MAVAIIGAGQSKFGTRKDVNVAELAWEAVKPAMQSANVEQKDIDFMVVGTAGMTYKPFSLYGLTGGRSL